MEQGDVYAWIWAVLLTAGGVIELRALQRDKSGDTLSESVWRWFSVKEKGPYWRLRRSVLLLGLVWLLVHFMSGGEVV